MRFNARLFRVSVWLATTSLSVASVAPAWAQPAAPDEAAPEAAGDPPALAGRVSAVSGTVSTHAAGQTDWSPAAVNTPVTNGDSFWTQPQSTATIEIGGDHFVLNEATELDIAGLDQSQFTGTEAQGEMFLSLPELPQGQSFTVNTPRGAVQITATGQYDIIAGDTATPTTITVFNGTAQVTGSNVNLSVAANQAATITGTDQLSGSVGPAQPDAFARAQLSAGAPAPLPAAVPQQVRYMTGGADLAQYGSWQSTSDYGQVWYPNNVGGDWAPYREGHWSYVGPWGWTWVDQEPWGFAPFHYGRWVNYGGRWGWVAAAPDAPVGDYPVYAPALVAFVGIGAGVLGASIGFGGGWRDGGVGWVPLGFREPFRPWYHVSDRYLQNVNRVSVVNVRNITVNNIRNVTINRYANARFATVAPAAAMVRGEALRGVARPLPEAALAHAEPVVGRLPVRPSAETPGLTRAEARRYNVSLPAHPVGRVAPGPAVRPGGSFAHPALRPAGTESHFGDRGAGGHQGEPALPNHAAERGAPGPRIGAEPGARPGLPPLRPANEVHNRPQATPAAGDHRGPETPPRPAAEPARPAERGATAPELRREPAAEPHREQAAEPHREQAAEPHREQAAEPHREQAAEPHREQAAEPHQEQAAEPRRAPPERPAAPHQERLAPHAPEHLAPAHVAPHPAELRRVPEARPAPRPEARPAPPRPAPAPPQRPAPHPEAKHPK